MGTKISTVALGYPEKDYNGMLSVSKNTYDNGLYSTLYMALFPDTQTSKVDYKTQLDKSDAAETRVNEGGSTHDTTVRNNEFASLHVMNVANVNYVNQLFRGNKINLEKSGFPLSKEPSPIGVPDPVVIRKATNGPVPGSVKLFINPMTGALSKKRTPRIYYIFVTDDPNSTDNLKCVLHTTSSRKLIVTGVTRGKDQYYYITCETSAGESELSGRWKYMLN